MNLTEYAQETRDSIDRITQRQTESVIEFLKIKKGIIHTFGNGGSSSSASHFTQDLMKACNRKSFCASDNSAYNLAIANDNNFNYIFSSYVLLNCNPDDVVFLISGSGKSLNIINAMWTAKYKKMKTIGLVGFDGGILYNACDYIIHVKSNDMRKVESAMSIILHYIIDQLAI